MNAIKNEKLAKQINTSEKMSIPAKFSSINEEDTTQQRLVDEERQPHALSHSRFHENILQTSEKVSKRTFHSQNSFDPTILRNEYSLSTEYFQPPSAIDRYDEKFSSDISKRLELQLGNFGNSDYLTYDLVGIFYNYHVYSIVLELQNLFLCDKNVFQYIQIN